MSHAVSSSGASSTALESVEPEAAKVPSFYINAASVAYNDYEVHLRFYLKEPGIDAPLPVVDVRMSPQHAWVMSKLLARKIAEYIEKIGPFTISEAILQGLELEDIFEQELGLRSICQMG